MEEISNKEYRQREGLSASDLKRMVKSMAHWKYWKEHPEENDTPSLILGRAAHKAILEPYDFDNEYIVSPKFDRRTKEGRTAYENFLKQAEGREVIDEELYQQVCDMREVVHKNPLCMKLINGEHEKSYFWTDERTGIKCKCRPDSHGKIGDTYVCVDYKTTADAETDAFMRQAIKLNYDIQLAHYTEGLKANTGNDYIFVFIVQEVKPPYAINILQADEYFAQSGSELRNLMLDNYKECVARNEWPSYMGFSDELEIASLSVPNWLKGSLQAESEVE